MAEGYVVINGSRQIYYLSDKMLLDFLNETGVDKKTRRNWKILPGFPLPVAGTMVARRGGSDGDGHSYGQFCPFSGEDDEGSWPSNAVVILHKGEFFVPPKITVETVVKAEQYNIPIAPQVQAKKPAAKKSAAKKSRKR